jgi:predicted MPP superfamily phosphohydrolase
LLAAAGAVLLTAAFWVVPSSLVLREYSIAADLPALKGRRIAVIADLHAGAPFIDAAKLDEVVAMTNAARPDLVLLTGDYAGEETWLSDAMPYRAIARHLARLEAPMGVFAVLGNHEAAQMGAARRALEQAGIFVLHNFQIVIGTAHGPLLLAGIGDREMRGDDIAAALGRIPKGMKALCFTHSPDVFPELPSTCALTIAGHTHGGQVVLPFIGRPIVPSRFGQRYAHGVVREGNKTLFVSTGIGTTHLPVRLGVTPEISLLKIQ